MTALVFTFLVGCATPASPAKADQSPTPTEKFAPSTFSDREPKRLEAKILIETGETYFADGNGTKGGTFHLPAGKVVGIHVRNIGQLDHEIVFGRGVTVEEGAAAGYSESLFKHIDTDLFVFHPQKTEIEAEDGFSEVELEPGADVWLRTTFPTTVKGTWEIACFVPGHYDAGMKATLIIE